jgi:hypothetical protein
LSPDLPEVAPLGVELLKISSWTSGEISKRFMAFWKAKKLKNKNYW